MFPFWISLWCWIECMVMWCGLTVRHGDITLMIPFLPLPQRTWVFLPPMSPICSTWSLYWGSLVLLCWRFCLLSSHWWVVSLDLLSVVLDVCIWLMRCVENCINIYCSIFWPLCFRLQETCLNRISEGLQMYQDVLSALFNRVSNPEKLKEMQADVRDLLAQITKVRSAPSLQSK